MRGPEQTTGLDNSKQIMGFIAQLKDAGVIVDGYIPSDNYYPYAGGATHITTDVAPAPVNPYLTGTGARVAGPNILRVPKTFSTTVISVFGLLTACANAGTPQTPAEVVMAAEQPDQADQGGQNTETGDKSTASTQEGAQELQDLKQNIQLILDNLTAEEVGFVTDAYAGPDSLAPKLLTNLDRGADNIQNWNALLVSRLLSTNPQVVQETIDDLGITPKALKSYYEQANNKLAAVEGADYTTLTPQNSMASYPDEASKLHAHAFMLALINVVNLVETGDVSLATKGLTTGETNLTKYNTVIIDGREAENPTTVQIIGSEVVVGNDLPTKGVGEIDIINMRGIAPINTYVVTAYTDVKNEALTIFGTTGYEVK